MCTRSLVSFFVSFGFLVFSGGRIRHENGGADEQITCAYAVQHQQEQEHQLWFSQDSSGMYDVVSVLAKDNPSIMPL